MNPHDNKYVVQTLDTLTQEKAYLRHKTTFGAVPATPIGYYVGSRTKKHSMCNEIQSLQAWNPSKYFIIAAYIRRQLRVKLASPFFLPGVEQAHTTQRKTTKQTIATGIHTYTNGGSIRWFAVNPSSSRCSDGSVMLIGHIVMAVDWHLLKLTRRPQKKKLICSFKRNFCRIKSVWGPAT
jgi:hypothetical protein